MSRPIEAPRHFSFLTALAILAGLVAAELLASWAIERAYLVSVALGLLRGDATALGDTGGVMLVAKLLACGAIVALALRRTDERWNALGRGGFTPWRLALAFVPFVLATTIFVSEVDNFLRLFSDGGLDDWNVISDVDLVVGLSWTGPVLVVLVAPLTEEIIFRGLILRGLLARWPAWVAIVVSAALFTVMHFNPAQAPIAFALGLVLGWTYARTRSLGLCVLGHALNNAASFFPLSFPFAVDNYDRIPEVPGSVFHPWWFDLMGVALFASGCWLLHRFAPAARPWKLPPPPAPEPPLLPGEKVGCQSAVHRESSSLMSAELVQLVTSLAQRARAASFVLATAPTAKKNAALDQLAQLIDASHAVLLEANARDLASPEAAALSAAARDRLTLNEKRLRQLAVSVREVTSLPDPVGETLETIERPNGLIIRKVRVPIGVIGIIYEARPNVTIDCAILCLKSGNACILRGGKECFHTNTALAALIQQALAFAGLSTDAVQLVPTTDRAALTTLLKLDTLIHCVIPRGGENLIRYVAENSTIPVIKHYKGVCFVYVDEQADLAMAEAITLNAKVQRPSACNAAEQLLVHRAVAEKFLPSVARALAAKKVELRCDAASAAILDRADIATTPATTADYQTEFLDYVIAVRVVDSLDAAIATINRDSSNHSDAIITANESAAKRFLAEVDSATVYWNASTRFTDGFEFGYGAEIGISTDRLHARGPMGLRELCSHKFLIEGNGHLRE